MKGIRTSLACLLAVAAVGVAAEPHTNAWISEVSVVFPPDSITLTPADVVWASTVAPPVAVSAGENTRLRIRFSGFVLPQGDDFRIEIADSNGQVHDTLDRARMTGSDPVWSHFVPGRSASVRVRGPDAVEGLTFTIDRVLYPFKAVAVESFFGEGQLVNIVDYNGDHAETVRAVATSVAKIDFVVGEQGDTCSAFRVGRDVIQTSAHCVATEEICKTTVVVFGYQKNAFGAVNRGQQVRCVEIVAKEGNERADTSLLRVTPVPEDQYAIVAFRTGDPGEDEPLFIVQHPGGEAKKVSIVDCMVFDDGETAQHPHGFGHSCDTKSGSSGAPVFDLEGRVVGQQRSGHRNPNVTDKPNLATFGSLLRLDTAAAEGHAPLGVETGPDAATAVVPSDAVPLPLPIAPNQLVPDDAETATGPSASSPGSHGSDTIIPDTGQ